MCEGHEFLSHEVGWKSCTKCEHVQFVVLGFVFMMLVDQISTRRNEGLNASQANSTATIGLVVHAAADGIALGAAATTSHQDVEMIVFLAIMLHKAPGMRAF